MESSHRNNGARHRVRAGNATGSRPEDDMSSRTDGGRNRRSARTRFRSRNFHQTDLGEEVVEGEETLPRLPNARPAAGHN